MANRAYLSLSHQGLPDVEPTAETIIVASSACYPPLWWSIFDTSSIFVRTAIWEDKEGSPVNTEVPILIVPTEKALDLALNRRDLFFSYVSRTYLTIYDQWMELLRGVDAPFIMLFTDEIAAMDEPVSLAINRERYEKEFQHVAVFVRAMEQGNLDDWIKLFRQVQIDLHPKTRELTFLKWEKGAYQKLSGEEQEIQQEIAYRFLGYYWERPVPWDY
jgi:hypothetical protein